MELFTAIRLLNHFIGKPHSPADIEALAAANIAEKNRRDEVKAVKPVAVKPVVVTPVAEDRKTVDEEEVRIANENLLREATEMAARRAAKVEADEATKADAAKKKAEAAILG